MKNDKRQRRSAKTPINLNPPHKSSNLTGFIIIRMSAHVPPTDGDLRKPGKKRLPAMTRFLERHPEMNTRRLIRGVATTKLLEMENKAKASKFPPLHSLTTYWRLDYRGLDMSPEELLRTVQQLPEVEHAYLEKAVSDPVVIATNDTYAGDQDYLDAAQVGIDARWAWTQANGDGASVGLIDLERAWNLQHEDLNSPTLIFNDNRNGMGGFRGDHGTAVLGIVGGVDNAVGIVGVAPGVSAIRVVSRFQAATNTDSHVADAIMAAIDVMAPGDVLLLEVQRDFLPTETDSADFDAIRLATANGIIVVEPAGNGNLDLDAVVLPGDSGAIIVGSCESALPHNRFVGCGPGCGSNFGSRIDCFAWGENIVSAGYGDLNSGLGINDNDIYTFSFGGTSGAVAIIAGAALIVQGMYQATGARLSPVQMREILSDATTGTPQGPDTLGDIGVMPNLRAILETTLGLTPDVYLRDDVGDTGVVPSSGMVSASPDIIVRPVVEPSFASTFGEGSGSENSNMLGSRVESGHDNFIYVRMRNRSSTTAANNTTATVYWSEVSTLVTPDQWHLIGTSAPVNVPAGDTLVVTAPIVWRSADIPAAGHYCFVGILNQARDLAPPIPPANDWDGFLAFIRNYNNVTWRNFNVVNNPADPLALEFKIAGAPDRGRNFDLEFIRLLPSTANVVLEMPLALFTQLDRSSFSAPDIDRTRQVARVNLPRLRSFPLRNVRLSRAAEFRCRLILSGLRGITSGQSVAVRQVFEGQEVGRVTWALQRTAQGGTPPPRRRR